MEPQHDDPTPAGRDERGPRLSLGWPVLLLAGWLLYEGTAEPGLGAMVACAKFGWADLQAAYWLGRVDPDRRRGATCFWWYLAFGLWKIAVMATLTMILLGLLGALLNGPPPAAGNNNPSPVFAGAMAAAAVGFVFSSLVTFVAVGYALRNGVRVWLGVAPYRARRQRFWPPHHGKVNFAPYVAFTTLILSIWAVVLAVIVLACAWQPRDAFTIVCLLLGTIALIAFLVMAFPLLARRLFARTPLECWEVEPGEAVYQAAHSVHDPERFR
jgi:hypothetical protein